MYTYGAGINEKFTLKINFLVYSVMDVHTCSSSMNIVSEAVRYV